MPYLAQITECFKKASSGDAESVEVLWNHFFSQMVRLASRRLPLQVQTMYDGEDAALSAFQSFFGSKTADRFPHDPNRNEIWKMLAVITIRKVLQRRKYSERKKRTPSLFGTQRNDVVCSEALRECLQTPDAQRPEIALEAAEECERLYLLLPDESLRTVVTFKLEGMTNREIAQKLGCTETTVERKLARIRSFWQNRME